MINFSDHLWQLWETPAARFDDANQEDTHSHQHEGFIDAASSTPGTLMFADGASTPSGSLMLDGNMWHEEITSSDGGMKPDDDIANMRETERLEKRRSEWSRKLDDEERKLNDMIMMNRSMDTWMNNEDFKRELHQIWRNIVEVTHEIRQRKPVSFNRQKMLAERRYVMKLRNDYARIRYKAK